MRRVSKIAVCLFCAQLLLPASVPAQAEKEHSRPKLVVVLVVDQLRADYLEKYSEHWTGGLRRLLEKGAWFRQAAYPYASTRTCVGHATISTGSFPATHGIISNLWWDRESGKMITCTEDAQAQAVSYGPAVKGGESAARLVVPTFADELRAQAGAPVRVVTFSLKARSAIMLAGHRADAVTWHDETTGAWVTSSAYASAPVGFLQQYVRAHPVEADFGKLWTRALPASAYLFENAAAGERPPAGWTSTFPHVLKGSADKPDAAFYALWERSPFADAYLAQMAASAVDALGLGKGRGTDYLGVSFSTFDLVGHHFGPFSHEVQDVLARLDVAIGGLLDHLDRAVGPRNYVVALSADHGVAPIPQQMTAAGLDGGLVGTSDLTAEVQKVLETSLGAGQHLAPASGSDLYFAQGVYAKLAGAPEVMEAVVGALLAAPGVARVLRSEELHGREATDDPILRATRLSYYAGRSGDLIVMQKPYWLFGVSAHDLGFGLSTDHGSPYNYDTRVPVILMGAGVRRGEYQTAATPADIAPTLAFLCAITLGRSDGRVLVEALAPSRAEAPLPVH